MPFPVGKGNRLTVPEQIALEAPSEDPQKRRAGGGRNGSTPGAPDHVECLCPWTVGGPPAVGRLCCFVGRLSARCRIANGQRLVSIPLHGRRFGSGFGAGCIGSSAGDSTPANQSRGLCRRYGDSFGGGPPVLIGWGCCPDLPVVGRHQPDTHRQRGLQFDQFDLAAVGLDQCGHRLQRSFPGGRVVRNQHGGERTGHSVGGPRGCLTASVGHGFGDHQRRSRSTTSVFFPGGFLGVRFGPGRRSDLDL